MYTLQLIDLPSGADLDAEGGLLGTRQEVIKRLGDLLPGATFDDRGRGAFRRGPYQIAFTIQGEESRAINVTLDQAEGFTVLTRITEKTGWRVVDADTRAFVDLEASRAIGRIVQEGEAVDIPRRPRLTAGRPSPIRMLTTAAATIVGVAVVGVPLMRAGSALGMKLPGSILSSPQAAARFEKYADRTRRRATIVKTLAPAFRSDPIVEQMLDVQMAARAYWNFIDGRFSSPELLSDTKVWSRFQLPAFLPESFGNGQRDGYSFEFRGENCEVAEPNWPECAAFSYIARPLKADDGRVAFALFSADDRIHYRNDGRIPQREDPTIDSK